MLKTSEDEDSTTPTSFCVTINLALLTTKSPIIDRTLMCPTVGSYSI